LACLFVYFSSELVPHKILGGRFDVKTSQFVSHVEIALIGGRYVWVSNENKPLNRIVWKGLDHNNIKSRITYFINPNGEGYIAIQHEPSHWYGTAIYDDRLPNLAEFKLNEDGRFTKSEWFTDAMPYPGRKWSLLQFK
jgi:hypothetical protein